MLIRAEPFDFPCRPERCALVLIDMQRDFIEPGGFGESLGNDVALLEAIRRCGSISSAARDLDM